MRAASQAAVEGAGEGEVGIAYDRPSRAGRAWSLPWVMPVVTPSRSVPFEAPFRIRLPLV